MNEDMTLKLFDNNLWAPNNIVAFDKNVVNAMNKKIYVHVVHTLLNSREWRRTSSKLSRKRCMLL